MQALSPVDLNRIQVDQDTFLGRTLVLGITTNRFPQRIVSALGMYLQSAGTEYARRFRDGIALSSDQLAMGVRRTVACMDVGLRELSEDDLNRAVDLTEPARFEELRRLGYQRLFDRLREIRDGAREILGSPYVHLIGTDRADLEEWATISPEGWTKRSEVEGREVLVAPDEEWEAFRWVDHCVRFLGSLPKADIAQLVERAAEGADFSRILANLTLGLAIGADRLILTLEDIRRFQAECVRDGALSSTVAPRVRMLVRGHLDAHSEDDAYKEYILGFVEEELDALQELVTRGMDPFECTVHFFLRGGAERAVFG